jgi:hypothetical protein
MHRISSIGGRQLVEPSGLTQFAPSAIILIRRQLANGELLQTRPVWASIDEPKRSAEIKGDVETIARVVSLCYGLVGKFMRKP